MQSSRETQSQTQENLESERLASELASSAPRPPKDNWDKLAAIAPIISGALIFLMGGYFTYSFNQQQLKLQEIQTIEKFIPHLMGNDQSKRASILAISSLTNAELASRFAQIFASPGTVSALQSMAESGTNKDKSVATDALARALENLAARESRLDQMETAFEHALAAKSKTKDSQELDQPEEAQKLERLAIMCRERGQLAVAQSLLKQALSVRLKNGSEKDTLNTLKKLADIDQALGDQTSLDATNKLIGQMEKKEAPAPPPLPTAPKTTTDESQELEKAIVAPTPEAEMPIK
jgi:hypothetical protein